MKISPRDGFGLLGDPSSFILHPSSFILPSPTGPPHPDRRGNFVSRRRRSL